MDGKTYLKKRKRNHFLFENARIVLFSGNSNSKIYNSFEYGKNSLISSLNPLTPVISSLCVFGLYTSPLKKKLNKCCKIIHFIHILAVLISLHYWTILYLSYFCRSVGTWKLFNQAMIIWTSAITYDVFLWQKNNITLFISLFVKDHLFQLSKVEKKKLLKRVRLLNAGVWLYLFLWVMTFLVIPTKKVPEEHFTASFYTVIANRTSRTFQKFLIQVNDGYLCFIVEGNLTFCTTFYIIALQGCTLWFQVFEKLLMSYSRSNTSNIFDMKYAQKLYSVLARRVKNVDDAFSVSVLFWYFMVTVVLCIRVIAIVSDDNTSANIQSFLTIGFGLFRGTFIILLGISFHAQYLIDTAQKAVLKIEKCLENEKDFASHHSYEILLRKAEITPVVVTLWKFCPIGKPFLMSCVQTMTTYVIICLQMTEKLKL